MNKDYEVSYMVRWICEKAGQKCPSPSDFKIINDFMNLPFNRVTDTLIEFAKAEFDNVVTEDVSTVFTPVTFKDANGIDCLEIEFVAYDNRLVSINKNYMSDMIYFECTLGKDKKYGHPIYVVEHVKGTIYEYCCYNNNYYTAPITINMRLSAKDANHLYMMILMGGVGETLVKFYKDTIIEPK